MIEGGDNMDYIITKIEVFKKNEDYVNLYVNDEYLLTCNKEIIYIHKLKLKQIVDITQLQEIAEEDNYVKCKFSAIKLIERSYKTEKELRKRLMEKGYTESSIHRAISFLKEYSFVDDDKYAEAVVKYKSVREGKNKIKIALIKKGIDEQIIKEKLDSIDEEVQKQGAMKLGLKKYNSLIKTEKDKYKMYGKISNCLITKGYSYGVTKLVLNSILKDQSEENF